MDLPSFLWLWKIAAWSMGLAIFAYLLLAFSGGWMYRQRAQKLPRPKGLRLFHYLVGGSLVFLVLLLLSVGLIGTIGHYGSLGHSPHLIAGLLVVILVLVSAISATQISPQKPWLRSLHISTNVLLLFSFMWVGFSGWLVVQKYLP